MAILLAALALIFSAVPLVAQPQHPLDPLTAAEIRRTVEVLEGDARFGTETRFALIDLHEPLKEIVFQDLERGTARRASRSILYDWSSRTASEAVVDLV